MPIAIGACGRLRADPLDAQPIDDLDSSSSSSSSGGESRADATPLDPPDARGPATTLPEDTDCSGDDTWTSAARRAECRERRVREVGIGATSIPGDGIDIAVNHAGQVAIANVWMAGIEHVIEAGFVTVYSFDGTAPSSAVRPVSLSPEYDYTVEGQGAKLVATDDAYLLLGQRNEYDEGGDVLLWRLPFGASSFDTNPRVVFSRAIRSTPLSLALGPNREIVASAIAPGASEDIFVTAIGVGSAANVQRVESTFSMPRGGPFSSGGHRLVFDTVGSLHVVYESGMTHGNSITYHRKFNNNFWAVRRTIDQAPGVRGSSLAAMASGNEMHAVYLGQDKNTAHLVHSWWEGDSGEVQTEILADGFGLQTADTGVIIHGRLAAAVDAASALHIAYTKVNLLNRDDLEHDLSCSIHYLREGARNGERVWLSDQITDDFACNVGGRVALAVEPDGRPHIAFQRGQRVYYATRFDR